ncbi:phage antirepressor KilAC domain-containing protein [Roseburia hominis]|nr:phage antirepressor KilAC domain-containing protein [Roseburia hominis]
MNDLQIFNNEEFGKVRTALVNEEPMFCLIDICKALEIKNATDVAKRLDEDELTRLNLGSRAGETNFITESGLYAVILRSDKPNAKKFRKWVTSEVLPSIRKNGGYIAGQENMTDDELMAKALMVAQNKIAERDKQIERMKPKEIFADAVSASETSILVGDLAKLISQNGYKIGQKRLFEWLRTNNFLIKCGSSRNMPQQRFVEQGLFEVKESNVQNPDGSVRITRTTKVTGKGQIYFVNKFLQKSEVAV